MCVLCIVVWYCFRRCWFQSCKFTVTGELFWCTLNISVVVVQIIFFSQTFITTVNPYWDIVELVIDEWQIQKRYLTSHVSDTLRRTVVIFFHLIIQLSSLFTCCLLGGRVIIKWEQCPSFTFFHSLQAKNSPVSPILPTLDWRLSLSKPPSRSCWTLVPLNVNCSPAVTCTSV